MILELRDQMPPSGMPMAPEFPALRSTEEDVLSTLGYQRAAAEKALATIAKDNAGKSFDQMFRAVLGRLSK